MHIEGLKLTSGRGLRFKKKTLIQLLRRGTPPDRKKGMIQDREGRKRGEKKVEDFPLPCLKERKGRGGKTNIKEGPPSLGEGRQKFDGKEILVWTRGGGNKILGGRLPLKTGILSPEITTVERRRKEIL